MFQVFGPPCMQEQRVTWPLSL